jgi:site-specific recombinase XerD
LAMRGVDLLSIKTLLGHTDLKTTQIYAHLAPQHLRDVVKVLDNPESQAK